MEEQYDKKKVKEQKQLNASRYSKEFPFLPEGRVNLVREENRCIEQIQGWKAGCSYRWQYFFRFLWRLNRMHGAAFSRNVYQLRIPRERYLKWRAGWANSICCAKPRLNTTSPNDASAVVVGVMRMLVCLSSRKEHFQYYFIPALDCRVLHFQDDFIRIILHKSLN